MLESQIADEIANLIRMTRSQYSGTIIIVEGGPDLSIYGRLVNRDYCISTPAKNKDNVIQALRILETDDVKGILGIIDSDFSKVDGQCLDNLNLLTTDTHDLESMIFSSNALDKIVAEYGDHDRITNYSEIREILLKNALPVGLVRWLSLPHKKNLCIDFKEIEFSKFIDRATFSVIIETMLQQLNRSQNLRHFDEKALHKDINILISKKFDMWQICCGHDLVQILAFGLSELIGNEKGHGITIKSLDGILRVAYEEAHFRTTHLYRKMISWEVRNTPYKIF